MEKVQNVGTKSAFMPNKIFHITLFGLQSYRLLKNIPLLFKTLTILLLTLTKNILSFTLFYEKRKCYRYLISYEQCRVAKM